MVEVLFAMAIRETAATTPGWAQAFWAYQPAGGTEYSLVAANVSDVETAVGSKALICIGTTLTLAPGDKITGYTSDLGTGGTVYYKLQYKITEFDA